MGRSKKLWIKEAASKNPGALRKALHVPSDQNIPVSDLKEAMRSKNATTKKRAILANTLKNLRNNRKR